MTEQELLAAADRVIHAAELLLIEEATELLLDAVAVAKAYRAGHSIGPGRTSSVRILDGNLTE